jgi:hypothetical protein
MRVVGSVAGSLHWPPEEVKATLMITGIVGPVGARASLRAVDRPGNRGQTAVRPAPA